MPVTGHAAGVVLIHLCAYLALLRERFFQADAGDFEDSFFALEMTGFCGLFTEKFMAEYVGIRERGGIEHRVGNAALRQQVAFQASGFVGKAEGLGYVHAADDMAIVGAD